MEKTFVTYPLASMEHSARFESRLKTCSPEFRARVEIDAAASLLITASAVISMWCACTKSSSASITTTTSNSVRSSGSVDFRNNACAFRNANAAAPMALYSFCVDLSLFACLAFIPSSYGSTRTTTAPNQTAALCTSSSSVAITQRATHRALVAANQAWYTMGCPPTSASGLGTTLLRVRGSAPFPTSPGRLHAAITASTRGLRRASIVRLGPVKSSGVCERPSPPGVEHTHPITRDARRCH
mmetsp:Transcript_3717/g.13756  ORF Transcript_3717/g.13756 Transcript_3717/m.13756 type:complete len:242 (+) Transcript_3717:651-1376(+)